MAMSTGFVQHVTDAHGRDGDELPASSKPRKPSTRKIAVGLSDRIAGCPRVSPGSSCAVSVRERQSPPRVSRFVG
jgi:hypothetical protein